MTSAVSIRSCRSVSKLMSGTAWRSSATRPETWAADALVPCIAQYWLVVPNRADPIPLPPDGRSVPGATNSGFSSKAVPREEKLAITSSSRSTVFMCAEAPTVNASDAPAGGKSTVLPGPVFPAGTVLHQTSWHDNSATNKRNPDPTNWVGSGNRTVDEMSIGHIDFIYLSDEEYQQELRARGTRQTEQQ